MKYKLNRLKTLTLVMALSNSSITAPISVLANGHWSSSYMQSMTQAGLMEGRGDHSYDPDELINRAEFITIVNNTFGFTQEANVHFSDVSPHAWYSQQIARAVSAGYIQGFGDNTVRPANHITRAEVSVILNNLLSLPTALTSSFADANEIPSWAYGAVNSIAQAGLVRGFPDGTFRANNNITRGEATVILSLVRDLLLNYDSLEELSGETPLEEIEATVIDGGLEIRGDFGTEELQIVTGDVIITGNSASVVRNLEIHGDLTIEESLANNLVFLNNVTVTGALHVHSANVHLLGEFNDVYMDQENTRLRLRNSDATIIENLNVLSGAIGSRISLDRNTRIENADINARVAINGTGRIGSANLRVSGVTVTNNTIIQSFVSGSQPLSGTTIAGGGGGGNWSGGGGGGWTPPPATPVDSPIITSGNFFEVDGGVGGSHQVVVTGANVTFTLEGAPSGVTIGSNSGMLTVSEQTAAREHEFTIAASNAMGTYRQTFTLMVNAISVPPAPEVCKECGCEDCICTSDEHGVCENCGEEDCTCNY